MMWTKKNFRSLLTLALPYVITVILPVISVVCLVNVIRGNYQEKILSDKQKSIESAFERFLQKIDTIETLAYTIEQNDIVSRYAYAAFRGTEHSLLESMEVSDFLKSLMFNNNVETIYYYDAGDERIITPKAVFSDAKDYFKFTYQQSGYSQEESIDRLRNAAWGCAYSPVMAVSIDNKPTEIIEYRSSVPIKLVSKSQSQLILVMEVKDIFDDLYDILETGSEFYVYDSRGEKLFSSGTQYEVCENLSKSLELLDTEGGTEELYGMLCQTEDRFWTVKVYIPDLLGVDSSQILAPHIWLLVIVPVVVSIFLCMYFTYKNHMDILEILKLFKSQGKEAEEEWESIEEVGYKLIRKYADQIIRENNRFKERITNYEYSYKYEVLDKLIRNTYETTEDIARAVVNADLQIKEGKCAVLCIRYEGHYYRTPVSEDVTVKDFVKALLEEMMERQCELFDTSARETICVLSLVNGEDSAMILRDLISRLNVEIMYPYGIEASLGVGDVVDSIYQISESYIQAKEVIRYNETSGEKIFLYEELTQRKDVYYYPQEFDEKICNYMAVGKAEEAKQIIQKIYEENFQNSTRQPSAKAIGFMKKKLWENLLSLAAKYEISAPSCPWEGSPDNECAEEGYSDMEHLGKKYPGSEYLEKERQEAKEFFRVVCDLVDRITLEIGNKKKQEKSYSVSRIMEYVNENYCDSALSLKQISQTFGFHENYISNLFKNAYGENLSAVVEKLRIEKATDLIKNSNQKIEDIAIAVGYTSSASFRRAFKKITGVSPGEYRGI